MKSIVASHQLMLVALVRIRSRRYRISFRPIRRTHCNIIIVKNASRTFPDEIRCVDHVSGHIYVSSLDVHLRDIGIIFSTHGPQHCRINGPHRQRLWICRRRSHQRAKGLSFTSHEELQPTAENVHLLFISASRGRPSALQN